MATLVARLVASRFVGVIGPSGSGKSSLVRAGLISSLASGALPGSEGWPTIVLTPGADPLELARRQPRSRRWPARRARWLAQLRDDPDGARSNVTARLLHDRPDGRLVVIVDQFEELFTVCRDPQARAWFTAALVGAAEDPRWSDRRRGPARGLLRSLRCRTLELAQALEDSQTLVGAMTDGELRRAVIEPAARAGLRVEEDVVTAVCREAAGEPGALPLISTALFETWVRRDGNTLTMHGVHRSGRRAGSVGRPRGRVSTTASIPRARRSPDAS